MMQPVEAANLNRALAEAAKLAGGELRMGGPPPGPVERKLQLDINKLKKELGKEGGKE